MFEYPIITIITAIICVLSVTISIYAYLKRKESFEKNEPIRPFSELAPGLVVTLGIFGTFVGIYLGLINFDPKQIGKSIPELLEGLKTAFITSIVAMACTIILKWTYSAYDKRELEKSKATTTEPIKIMMSMDSNLQLINEVLNKVFRSDEEYSLISQLKILRADINDLKREIIKSLDDFSKKVAELGTEAMIKALREVIEQFNAKLNDLVGAEFKQLKEAMIKLVDWQDNYKNQVDTMQSQLKSFLEGVKNTSNVLKEIEGTCKSISENLESVDSSISAISVSAEDIDAHVKSLNLQNKNLEESIGQIKNIGEEAKKVIPTLDDKMKKLIDNFANTVDANMKILKETINSNIASLNTMNEDHRKYTKESTNEVKKSIDEFKKNLQDTLVESLTSLAGQMVAISRKFADDYTPLAEKLREVLSIAEGMKDYDKNKLQ